MEKELILKIKIQGYPREIMVSKKMRAKYYKPGDKLANKYLTDVPVDTKGLCGKDKDGILRYLRHPFAWKKVGGKYRMYNSETNEDIVKNPSKAGKEKWLIIKGQDIYTQNIHPQTRNKIVGFLKDFWVTQLNKIIKSGDILSLQGPAYPVSVHFDYNANIEYNNDLDNYSLPYHKTLLDSLVSVGILRGDTVRDINGIKLTHTPLESMEFNDDISEWGQKAVDTINIKIYANRIQQNSVHTTGENR